MALIICYMGSERPSAYNDDFDELLYLKILIFKVSKNSEWQRVKEQ